MNVGLTYCIYVYIYAFINQASTFHCVAALVDQLAPEISMFQTYDVMWENSGWKHNMSVNTLFLIR